MATLGLPTHTVNTGAVIDPWVLITEFLNNWVAVDYAVNYAPAYMIDALGDVRCRGAIKNGDLDEVAFAFPSGRRPEKNYAWACYAYSGDGEIWTNAAGEVTPTNQGGDSTIIDLSCIRFKADGA